MSKSFYEVVYSEVNTFVFVVEVEGEADTDDMADHVIDMLCAGDYSDERGNMKIICLNSKYPDGDGGVNALEKVDRKRVDELKEMYKYVNI